LVVACHDYPLVTTGKLNVISGLVSKWTNNSVDCTRIYCNGGNVDIGTTNPANIFQIADGGRLKIANNNTDLTVIGCDDSVTNTKIVINGSTRLNTDGNIDYIGSSTGIRRFYTTNVGTEQMRIDNNGNVGIGTTDTSTYKLNVNGSINATSVLVDGTVISGSRWSVSTSPNIYYNTGNVTIGTTDSLTYKLNVGGSLNTSGNITTTSSIISTGSYIGITNSSSYLAKMYLSTIGGFVDFSDTNGNLSRLKADATSGGAFEVPYSKNLTLRCYNTSFLFSTIVKNWFFLISGNCTNAKNTTTWDLSSDHRIKENIKKTDLNICYSNVKNIHVYRYNYIKGFKKGLLDKTQLGFIAQQVKQHFPKSVSRDKVRLEDNREVPDSSSVSIDQINFTLFGSVKQLMKVVE
jgi:hypothetical protein